MVEGLPLMLLVGIIFLAVALAGALARRLGQSVIPAYILVGVLLGPGIPNSIGPITTGIVQSTEFIDVFSELGIVVLLFFLGLHVDVEAMLSRPRRILAVGTLDLLVTFGAGLAVGIVFGFSAIESLFVAGIIYISSSAVITKSLMETGWALKEESEPITGILVFEDLAMAAYLTLLSAVVLGTGETGNVAVNLGTGFLFLGAIGAMGWWFSDWLETLFDAESDELFLLRIVGATTGLAGAAHLLDVSPEVTALIVGGAIGLTRHEDRIERLIKPVRDLFVAVFFFSIGLSVGIDSVVAQWRLVLASLPVTVAAGVLSGVLSGWAYGLTDTQSLRVGFGIVPRGEFSLVIAALAASAGGGALGAVIPEFAVGYVLVMSVVGTLLMQHADRIIDAVWPDAGEPAAFPPTFEAAEPRPISERNDD
ncbi:K(+)/H(+) antiporter subunit KhtU [Halolamina litorea]|uniref:Cation:proton antiporter n=1 Tax=Halolamina litorea TaxID=1515593 RepID=A0ABD6BT37_9EURY|nr:cation:proton antiporter [Halolamina litorea]